MAVLQPPRWSINPPGPRSDRALHTLRCSSSWASTDSPSAGVEPKTRAQWGVPRSDEHATARKSWLCVMAVLWPHMRHVKPVLWVLAMHICVHGSGHCGSRLRATRLAAACHMRQAPSGEIPAPLEWPEHRRATRNARLFLAFCAASAPSTALLPRPSPVPPWTTLQTSSEANLTSLKSRAPGSGNCYPSHSSYGSSGRLCSWFCSFSMYIHSTSSTKRGDIASTCVSSLLTAVFNVLPQANAEKTRHSGQRSPTFHCCVCRRAESSPRKRDWRKNSLKSR